MRLDASSSYLFIDGGYLRERYKEAMKTVFGEAGELDYEAMKNRFGCFKAFYYDCVDEKRPKEQEDDFLARKKAQEDLFNRIRELSGFHVRTGTLSGRKQKEVDVALAVDMLTHAFYKNMSRAVLIAGDLDFRPVVESLIRLGTWVVVASARSSSAKPLQWAADQHQELTFSDFYGCSSEKFRSDHPVPRHATTNCWFQDGWTLERTGHFSENQTLLLKQGTNLMIQFIPARQARVNTLTFYDRELLERYFEAMFGHIEWRP